MKKLNLLCVLILSLFACATFAKDTLDLNPTVEEAARAYLVNQKMAGNADIDFQTLRVIEDDLGQTHIRMQAVLNGYMVYGHQVIVHLDSASRKVLSIDGMIRETDQVFNSKVAMDPMIGLDRTLTRMGVKEFDLTADPELAYVIDEKNQPIFTQMMVVSYENEVGPQVDRVFLDAATGELVTRHPQVYYSKNRLTYDANNGTSLPGTLRRSEGSGNTGDACLDAAHNYAGLTYDYYSARHGRDSLNNNGLTLKSTVHYSSNYNNAYWNSSQMVYGDGDGTTFRCLAMDADVVAHELSHGVCEYTANLTYSYESGALNEANSDIMAAAVEQYNGASTSDIWRIGEDVYTPNGSSSDALRYMNNPTQDGQSKDYYPERYTGSSDNGGVHLNSGIANLFFYLLVQGGTHPRGKTTTSVSGIGMVDASKIWYRALSVYMSSSTNFAGARTATLNSASDLFGSSSNQYTQVCNAWTAVGVGSSCSGGGGGGGSTGGELTNGQSVSGVGASTGSWVHFYIDVPSGASNLVMSISGGSGDADLYTRFGSQPTSSSYDCRPYKNGNSESCSVSAPNAGRYYVSLYAYSTFSSVTVTASYTSGGGGGGSCGDSGSVSNISASSGQWVYYTFPVDACATTVTISISGGSGDADLYVRKGANPTTSNYICRPYKTGNNETCTISHSGGAATYNIGIRAYSTFSGVTLNASYQ